MLITLLFSSKTYWVYKSHYYFLIAVQPKLCMWDNDETPGREQIIIHIFFLKPNGFILRNNCSVVVAFLDYGFVARFFILLSWEVKSWLCYVCLFVGAMLASLSETKELGSHLQ